MTYSLVYLRPDGWWEAGKGWATLGDAVADGSDHDWRGRAWGVAPTPLVVEVDGDRRLPHGVEPLTKYEGSFHD